jgi:Uma2 family endonuclease
MLNLIQPLDPPAIMDVSRRWRKEDSMMTGVEQRVVLHGISWQTYQELREVPESEHVRMTYQEGELELMSPSRTHEQFASLIDRLLQTWTLERGIDIQSCRTMTCKLKDLERGFEPDNCYYVAHEALVRNHRELDLTVDPPPDLAVEIDLGGRGRRKLGIYAAFRVPEVWWFDGQTLQVFVLQHNTAAGGRPVQDQYQECQTSASFPDLPPAEIEGVLAKLGTASETTLVRAFRDWVRKQA